VLESLKKRHSNRVYPAVPVPPRRSRETLDLVRATGLQDRRGKGRGESASGPGCA